LLIIFRDLRSNMSSNSLLKESRANAIPTIVEPQSDSTQPSAQNITSSASSNNLSTSFVPNDEQPNCDIEYLELTASGLTYVSAGAYGKVFKTQWEGNNVAVKFVSRRLPEQLIDFNRELRALRKAMESLECEKYIIGFFGLSK
ncbi:13899_t:CDS:2, partial [Dentiscutata heterogama]